MFPIKAPEVGDDGMRAFQPSIFFLHGSSLFFVSKQLEE